MSPELQTLDLLLGGDYPLGIVRELYPNDQQFFQGISALLKTQEVRLMLHDGVPLESWKWEEMARHGGIPKDLKLEITTHGVRRIA